MESSNPPWLRPNTTVSAENAPGSTTPERSPVLRSILDVLDSETDKDRAVELSDMLSHWREVTKKNNGENPMIAHQQILDFTKQLSTAYPDQKMDKVLLFHLISGSTVSGAEDKTSYIFDIPTENSNGQGVIESEIRTLSSSVE